MLKVALRTLDSSCYSKLSCQILLLVYVLVCTKESLNLVILEKSSRAIMKERFLTLFLSVVPKC